MTVSDHSPLIIRSATEADLPSVARLHVEAFSDSVLGRLGVEAVRRNYLWQLTGPHDLTALVAVSDNTVQGFIFGGVFRGSTIGFVKKEKWFLARRVLSNPSIMFRSVGWKRLSLAAKLLARRPGESRAEEPASVPPRSFGVLAIAVDPSAQGKGTGAALMKEAQRQAEQGDFVSMHLTVHPKNSSALRFYRSLGWTEMPERNGEWTGRMKLVLQDPGQG